jgi:hypothetical protein
MLTILLIAAAIYWLHGFWAILGVVLLIIIIKLMLSNGKDNKVTEHKNEG